MIRDARALRPTFVPDELHHREGDLEAVSSCLRPIEQGRSGEDVLITGPSGTGKTTLARYVTDELERATLGVTTGVVDCTSDSTKTEALHTLVRDLDVGHTIPRPAASTAELLDHLRGADDQVVIVLDEVDQLADRTLIQALYEIPHVTTLLVCIDEDTLLADARESVRSRIRTAVAVTLDKYRQEELADIIEARADVGLRAGAVSRETAERIADLAAGDAHYALAILRRAAQRAGDEDRDAISPALVEAVTEDANVDVHDRTVEQLSTHHRLLYDIIEEAGEIPASDLHDQYEACAENPRARSSRRRYLHVLEKYGLVEQIGATKGSRYRLKDPAARSP